MGDAAAGTGTRIAFVDHAKGLCIVMVVMMHSTLGLGEAVGAEGFMHALVAFTKPFRMPDFFLVCGLFLSLTIDRDWRTYLDRKLVHFLYFYGLWLAIQTAFKIGAVAPGLDPALLMRHLALALVEPYGTLWFIYILPVFFIATKALRRVPAPVLLAAAAALEIAHLHSDWTVPHEFARRYVYFLAGWLLAPQVFALAAAAARRPLTSVMALVAWAVGNGLAVSAGVSELPFVSLALGSAGALAVVAIAALLARLPAADIVRHAGANSIAVYLAFFLPMAAARAVLVKTGFAQDHVGWASLIVTVAALALPLALHALLRRTHGRFLFERPAWFSLARRRSPVLAPAE